MDNKEWLEQIQEAFEVALHEGDYVLCCRIIAEVFKAGETDASEKMIEMIEQAPIKRFANTPSPYGMA